MNNLTYSINKLYLMKIYLKNRYFLFFFFLKKDGSSQ